MAVSDNIMLINCSISYMGLSNYNTTSKAQTQWQDPLGQQCIWE